MSPKAASPYHLGEQHASALLRPIEAALAELEARLVQYVERIPMSDDDREAVRAGQNVVNQARAGLGEILARRPAIPTGGE